MLAAVKAGNAPCDAQVEYQELPAFVMQGALANISQWASSSRYPREHESALGVDAADPFAAVIKYPQAAGAVSRIGSAHTTHHTFAARIDAKRPPDRVLAGAAIRRPHEATSGGGSRAGSVPDIDLGG